MKKFFDLGDDNVELVNRLFDESGLSNYMSLKLFGVTSSKELIKVSQNGEIAKFVGKISDDVVNFIIYEEAFDRLDDDSKELLVKDAISTINYDSEKDKITIGAPMINITVWGREKYGDRLVNAAEYAVSAIVQIEEERKQAKEEEKARKAAERAAKKMS
ncbi:MAG: hypothetical protein J6Y37_18775 [Paludibacteraceae bacterium]|nr:hypothetical protein [Paludibacteraceae bacterium]